MKRLEQMSGNTRKWVKLYTDYQRRIGCSVDDLRKEPLISGQAKHQLEALEYMARMEIERAARRG